MLLHLKLHYVVLCSFSDSLSKYFAYVLLHTSYLKKKRFRTIRNNNFIATDCYVATKCGNNCLLCVLGMCWHVLLLSKLFPFFCYFKFFRFS